jgi:succinate dehydrogenase / fumarate reductase cytochrome b subunit
MSWILERATKSIGKKQLMALTGLGLCVFLVVHLAGNLLIFEGPLAFNGYARSLEANPLLIPAEVALALTFLLHVVLAVRVTLENKSARPIRYAVKVSEGTSTLASRTMWISGVITLVFIVLHLIHFKFAEGAKDNLHRLVVTTFHSLPYVVWYVFAVCVLGLHVGHGFQSAFRSLGLSHPNWTQLVRWVSRIFGVVVALGYASIPIWCYLTRSPQ